LTFQLTFSIFFNYLSLPRHFIFIIRVL
jgi:hypothetical protein